LVFREERPRRQNARGRLEKTTVDLPESLKAALERTAEAE
jgi:hypothetical protein